VNLASEEQQEEEDMKGSRRTKTRTAEDKEEHAWPVSAKACPAQRQ
jgi:hypothetical protein